MGRAGCVIGCFFLGCAAGAAPTGVVIELKDGSRLVGEADLEGLSLVSGLGAVKVKADQLLSLVPSDDKERVTIKTRGGDVVTGVPTPAKLELKTSFGKVSIPFALATRVDFSTKVGGVPLASSEAPANDTTVPELGFRCGELVQLEEGAQTTGGSVFVFGVNFRSGQPLLVVAATSDPRANAKLDRVRAALRACMGSTRLIRVKQPKYVTGTQTTIGARFGWVGFADNVSVE